MLLVLCMAATMLAGTMIVSAEETETPAPTSVLLNLFNAENLKAGTVTTLKGNGGKVNQGMSLRAVTYNSNGITNANVISEDGNNYIAVRSTWFGYNFRQTDKDMATYGIENCPVLSYSYDINIPSTETYKAYKRYASLPVGTSATGKYTSVATIRPKIENGKIDVEADLMSTIFSRSVSYTYDSWTTIKTLVWLDESSYVNAAVYANDTIIYIGKSRNTAVGMAVGDFNFGYYNSADGKTWISDAKGTWTDGILQGENAKATIVTTTKYDNIKLELLAEDNKISIEDLDYLVFSGVEFDALQPISDSYKNNASDANGVRTVLAKLGCNIFQPPLDSGLFSAVYMHGSSSEADTLYEVVEEADGQKVLKITATDYVTQPHMNRASIAKYVRGGETNTLVSKYRVKVASGSEAVERCYEFGLGLDCSSKNTETKTIRVRVKSTVVGGEISFDSLGYELEGKEKSETRPVSADQWIEPTVVAKVAQKEGGYEIKVYGIYNNEVIYENEHFLIDADYDGDDVADNIGLAQNTFSIGVAKMDAFETAVTYVDSMYVVKDNNFDWSAIDTDAWAVPAEVKFVKDGNDLKVSAISATGEKFTSGVMVVAIYNANGMLEEFIPVTTITDGDKTNSFDGTVPAAKLATGKIVKAFIVDGITSFKPLIANGKYIVE